MVQGNTKLNSRKFAEPSGKMLARGKECDWRFESALLPL